MRSLLWMLSLSLTCPAVAADSVQLVVNQPASVLKDHCVTDHCKAALKTINGAQKTLDIAIYGLRNQTQLQKAIVAAKKRGVVVRLIVDKDIDNSNYYTDTPKLEEALGNMVRDDFQSDKRTQATRKPYDPKGARCDRPPGFDGPAQCLGFDLGQSCLVAVHASREGISFKGDIMHNKFIIADGRRVWTGSTNMSDSGTGGYNANVVAVIDNEQVGGWFTDEFNQMFVDGRYHNEKRSVGVRKRVKLGDDMTVEVLFSPQDEPMDRSVRPLLQGATQQIDIAVFFLTHKGVTADLIDAHRRGVKVRVILDGTAAKNGYTKHEILRAAGIPVKIENWGGKMHMKSAIIDHKHVIVG
ncbi:MAG: phospholipase D-like domain-containing protein, partial [Myxococcota bacterium]